MNQEEYLTKKKKLEKQIKEITEHIFLRKGKTICSDVIYTTAKSLTRPVNIVGVPPGKTKEDAVIETLEARLKVAKKLVLMNPR